MRNLFLHGRKRCVIIGPSAAARTVRMGNMDCGREIAVERLQLGERKGIIQGCEIGGWIGLRDVEQNGRIFRDDATIRDQCRNAGLGVDREKFRLVLVASRKIKPLCFIGST